MDKRGGWHLLYHAANGSQTSHCGESKVSSHLFSVDEGKTWAALENPFVEPYKPAVMWEGDSQPQTYSTMERPHLYFDPESGDLTHLGVAVPLNIGDEGCPNATSECKSRGRVCSCVNCKYASHAGTALIQLQGAK